MALRVMPSCCYFICNIFSRPSRIIVCKACGSLGAGRSAQVVRDTLGGAVLRLPTHLYCISGANLMHIVACFKSAFTVHWC